MGLKTEKKNSTLCVLDDSITDKPNENNLESFCCFIKKKKEYKIFYLFLDPDTF